MREKGVVRDLTAAWYGVLTTYGHDLDLCILCLDVISRYICTWLISPFSLLSILFIFLPSVILYLCSFTHDYCIFHISCLHVQTGSTSL